MAGTSRIKLLATIACVGLAAACSGPGRASSAPSTTSGPDPVPTPSAPSIQPSPVTGSLDGLVVLADNVQGGIGLWTYREAGWRQGQSTPHASAIASATGGIAIANGQSVETRAGDDLGRVISTVTLRWPGPIPASGIRAVSVRSDGELALAVSEDRVGYSTARADGQIVDVATAASQPFTPLIAWLAGGRTVVLSTDKQQVSRLAVGNGLKDFKELAGLIGCRWLSVSGDGGTIAAATEAGIYVASAEAWLAGKAPEKIATLDPGVVVWAMAVDRSGARLAYLAGSVGADGTVASIHEIVYMSASGSWHKAADMPAPFTKALGQAWAG